MNIHVDTLEYASTLQKAGVERAHAEAFAKLQAKTVADLVDHELVTKDNLKSELTQTEARLKSEIVQLEARMEAGLKTEIAQLEARMERRMDAQMLQLRALQLGGAIAAFAISAIVLLSRLIR